MKLLQKTAAVLTGLALACSCTLPAFAEAAAAQTIKKDENVFLLLNSDGSVQQQIVSDWLHSDAGFADTADESSLKDIVNLKSDVQPVQNGKSLVWTSDEKDLYYQGTADQTPPVTAAITYTLDGSSGTAESFVGKSGHMVMRIALQNHDSETRTIAGRERTVYTPFATVVAADLPAAGFTNLVAAHGTVQTDASNQLVCFLAMPGMAETFDGLLTGELAKVQDYLLDEVVIEADVTDFTVPTVMIAAATDASALEEKIEVPDLSGQMGQLQNATAQLQSGTTTLAQAIGTLQAKMNEFAAQYATFDAGVDSALAGAGKVKNGAQSLLAGTQSLHSGSAQLADGTNTLQGGSAKLAASLNDKLVPGLAGALAQKESMQSKMTQLQGQVGALSLPDVAALKTKLGAGVGQVFDAAAAGAATVAAQQVSGGVIAGCKNAAGAAIDAAAPAAASGVANAAAGAVRSTLSASLAGKGLTDDQINEIIEGAASAASAAGAADIATGLKGAVTSAVDANVSVDAAAVASQITAGMAPQKEGAVSQVTAALDGLDVSSLQGLLGEFGTLADEANSMMGSVDTLAGALYNAANPADAETVVGAANAIAGGAQTVKEGADGLCAGAAQLNSGAAELSGGADALQTGLAQLSGASKTVKDAIGQFQTGAAQLATGGNTLQEGMDTYARDAIGKLTDKLDAATLDALTETLDAVQQRAQSYRSYTGCGEEMQCSVKFVMKTQGAADASAAPTETAAAEAPAPKTQDTFWTRIKNLFVK